MPKISGNSGDQEPEKEEKHVLTHFKKIDESDEYYLKKTKKTDSTTSANSVQIRTLFMFKSKSGTDLVNSTGNYFM